MFPSKLSDGPHFYIQNLFPRAKLAHIRQTKTKRKKRKGRDLFGAESREGNLVLGCFLVDEGCVRGTANSSIDGEGFIDRLVVEILVVDVSILRISRVSGL